MALKVPCGYIWYGLISNDIVTATSSRLRHTCGASEVLKPQKCCCGISKAVHWGKHNEKPWTKIGLGMYMMFTENKCAASRCNVLIIRDEMNGVLGYDSALVRPYWVGDSLSWWDEFCWDRLALIIRKGVVVATSVALIYILSVILIFFPLHYANCCVVVVVIC